MFPPIFVPDRKVFYGYNFVAPVNKHCKFYNVTVLFDLIYVIVFFVFCIFFVKQKRIELTK